GDENWRLYTVDVQTCAVKDLTPFAGVQAQLIEVSPKFPHEVLVGLHHRNPQWHAVYRIHIVTGEMSLLLQHDRFMGVTVDDEYRMRYAAEMTSDGGSDLYVPAGGDSHSGGTLPA